MPTPDIWSSCRKWPNGSLPNNRVAFFGRNQPTWPWPNNIWIEKQMKRQNPFILSRFRIILKLHIPTSFCDLLGVAARVSILAALVCVVAKMQIWTAHYFMVVTIKDAIIMKILLLLLIIIIMWCVKLNCHLSFLFSAFTYNRVFSIHWRFNNAASLQSIQ